MYQKLKDFQFTIVALILGIAIVFVGLFAICALNKDGIAVTGSAYKVVKSDTAVLKLELKATNPVKSAAYNKIKSGMAGMVKPLRKQNCAYVQKCA